MPAWHGARSAPAAPTLLPTKTLWVLQIGPEPPHTPGSGRLWSRTTARSVPDAEGSVTQAPPCPASTDRCPRARAAPAPWPGVPWQPQTPTWGRLWGSVPGCCHNSVPQFPPSLPQPCHGAQPAPQLASHTDPSACPHSLPRQNNLPPAPRPPPGLLGPTSGSVGPSCGAQPPQPHPSWGLPLPPSPGPQAGGWLPLSPHPGLCHPTVEEEPTEVLGCQCLGVLGCRLGGATGENKEQFRGR